MNSNEKILLLRDALKKACASLRNAAHATEYSAEHPSMRNYLDVLDISDQVLDDTAATSQQAEGEPFQTVRAQQTNHSQPLRDFMDSRKAAAPLPAQPQGQGAEKDAIDRIDELCTICAEAYQVVGVLADEAGRFDDPQVIKVLDNLSAQKMEHTDCLPFMSYPPSQAPEPAQQEAAGASFMAELDALLKKEEAFMGLVSALSIREIMGRHAASLPSPAPQTAVPTWLPMSSAPKDGTLVRLLVKFDENSTEDDDGLAPTIGFNNLEHDGIDGWSFAGWNWNHDCFDRGIGVPMLWLPFEGGASPVVSDSEIWQIYVDAQATIPTDEAPNGKEFGIAITRAIIARALARTAPVVAEGLKVWAYSDENEYIGDTLDDYAKHSKRVIGDEFDVTEQWSRERKFKIIGGGPTAQDPKASFIFEALDGFAAQGEGT